MRIAQCPQAAEAARHAETRLEHLLRKEPSRLLDSRQLQLLLGAEVGEQAALADAELAREALKRDLLHPFGGGELSRPAEDRLPGPVASDSPFVGGWNLDRHLATY